MCPLTLPLYISYNTKSIFRITSKNAISISVSVSVYGCAIDLAVLADVENIPM